MVPCARPKNPGIGISREEHEGGEVLPEKGFPSSAARLRSPKSSIIGFARTHSEAISQRRRRAIFVDTNRKEIPSSVGAASSDCANEYAAPDGALMFFWVVLYKYVAPTALFGCILRALWHTDIVLVQTRSTQACKSKYHRRDDPAGREKWEGRMHNARLCGCTC